MGIGSSYATLSRTKKGAIITAILILLYETDAKPAKPMQIGPGVLIANAKHRLIENMPIDETSLRHLARERARQIKGHLIQKGKISDERVLIAKAEIGCVSDRDIIRTNLTLSGT